MSLLADAEYLIDQLMEIVEVVATTDTTYSTGPVDKECIFCDGDMDYTPPSSYVHQPDCIVMKAKALLKEQQTQ